MILPLSPTAIGQDKREVPIRRAGDFILNTDWCHVLAPETSIVHAGGVAQSPFILSLSRL